MLKSRVKNEGRQRVYIQPQGARGWGGASGKKGALGANASYRAQTRLVGRGRMNDGRGRWAGTGVSGRARAGRARAVGADGWDRARTACPGADGRDFACSHCGWDACQPRMRVRHRARTTSGRVLESGRAQAAGQWAHAATERAGAATGGYKVTLPQLRFCQSFFQISSLSQHA
jgi:hypothetical protein